MSKRNTQALCFVLFCLIFFFFFFNFLGHWWGVGRRGTFPCTKFTAEAVCSSQMIIPSNVPLAISHPIILLFLHTGMASCCHSLIGCLFGMPQLSSPL